MGVACGDSAFLGKRAPPPTIEAVTLRGTSAETRVRFLATWLSKRLLLGDIDLVVTESPMNPAASKSDHSTIDLLGYYFCVHAVAAWSDIPVEAAPVMAIRKHFCGRGCAPPVRGRKRTAKEAVDARKFINETVLKRAILLGYLPDGSIGWDEANACALWDFACSKFARAVPAELAMFGARA